MATTGIFVLGLVLSMLQASIKGISLEKSHLLWSHVWKDLVLSQPSAGLIPKKGNGGRRWDLGSKHRNPEITEHGSEMGDQVIGGVLVALQKGLLAAWCEAP